MTNKEMIYNLFDELTYTDQVKVLVSLYYELDDYHKDQFLRETENA